MRRFGIMLDEVCCRAMAAPLSAEGREFPQLVVFMVIASARASAFQRPSSVRGEP